MARKPGATMTRGYHADGLPNLGAGNCQPSVRSGCGLQPLSRGDNMCKHLQMEPDGDPEARIRDLERPLADRAYNNEMGTQPYEVAPTADMSVPPYQGPPYPQPGASQFGSPQYGAPQFGSPYYAPPQQVVRKRSPALWLLPLIVGIIVVGSVGAVLFFNLSSFNTGSPVRPPSPGISGGGGSVDTPEIEIPTPEIPFPFDPSDEVETVEAGDTLSLGGIEQRKTVVCNQGTVNISGMTNTIEVQGDCAGVSVSGMNNIVTVESAGSITASGFDNKVTYRSGSPEVSQSGTGNVIEQG